MARKRKARVVEAPSEPETAQPIDPEPEPEPEQPQAEESVQTLAENPGVEEETVDGEKEEQVTETEVGEGEGEEEGKGEEEEEHTSDTEEHKDDVIAADTEEHKDDVIAADTEEHKDDVIAADTEEHKDDVIAADREKAEQDAELTEMPSEKSVSENGVGAEEQDGEGEDELGDEPLEKLLEPFSKDQLTLLIKEAVAKHPDVIENVHKLADSDPAHCKIFVHGLGWDAHSEMITSVFGKYGEIEDCKVVKDKNTGKSKGYGFILYKHRNGARRVLKEPQKMINGRMTSCQLASAGPIQTPPPVAVSSVPNPNMSEFTQRKIYVSNVSADIDPNKLLEFFSKFGEIEEGPLGLDKQTGKPRGFCLFVYKSVDSSKKALEEPHKNFEGHMLHCQKAIDGPKHSKSHINQQLGQQQQQQHHHHNQGHQGYYHNPAKKAKYSGSSGVGYAGGHLMAPSAGPTVPSVGFSPAAAPAAIGQAVAALLASQGGGLGMGNFLGGIGAGMNPQGMPPIMSNVGYGGQVSAGGYGGQPAMQGGYGGQPQMGQGGVRPHQGGAPYMGRGR